MFTLKNINYSNLVLEDSILDYDENGLLYIQYKVYLRGIYQLRMYFEDVLVYEDSSMTFNFQKTTIYEELCLVNGVQNSNYTFCPHLNKCVNLTTTSCCSLNKATPIFCKAKNECVSYRP